MYCIYEIKNLVNNKTYIGQHKTNDLNDNYMGSGNLIIQAIKKYGIENFEKTILAVTETKESINILEKTFIQMFWEIGKAEYNLAQGGLGGFVSYEANEKNRLAHLGRKPSLESNLKRSRTLKGHPSYERTEEWRRNRSKIMTGRKMSEKTRKKMSESHKGMCNTKGKHYKVIDGKRIYY